MLKKYIDFITSKATCFYTDENFNQGKVILPFFRVAVSFIAVVDVLSLGEDFKLLFSEKYTFVPRELMYLFSEYKSYFDSFYEYLQDNNFNSAFFENIRYIYILFLVLLMFGCFTRVVSFCAIIIQLIIFKSFNELNYGYDQFLTMSLFYCLVFPVGRFYSVDSLIFKKKNIPDSFNYLRIIQIHLCIVYFFAGIAKALDPDWWNGISLWRSMSSVYNDYLSISPYIFAVLGIGTVLLETTYALFIWVDKVRYIILSLCIAMHVGIAYLLGLYSFSAILIVWNITAFYELKLNELESK